MSGVVSLPPSQVARLDAAPGNGARHKEIVFHPDTQRIWVPRFLTALLHGPTQIAELPVPVAVSPGAVRNGHPERGHLVEYLAPNSVFHSLPRQRSGPHLGPDDRLVTIDRVLHHASLGAARELVPFSSAVSFDCANMAIALPHGGVRIPAERRVSLRRNHHPRPSSRAVHVDGFVDRLLVVCTVRRHRR